MAQGALGTPSGAGFEGRAALHRRAGWTAGGRVPGRALPPQRLHTVSPRQPRLHQRRVKPGAASQYLGQGIEIQDEIDRPFDAVISQQPVAQEVTP